MTGRIDVGIDVGSKELAVCAQRAERCSEKTFDNTPSGHKALIKWLSQRGKELRVCLEASGIYSFDVAVALSQADIPVMVVNPRAARNFAHAMMQRSKTDPLDAKMLAQYAARMPFEVWQPPSKKFCELRTISHRIESLKHLRAQESNRLHAAQATTSTPACVLSDIRTHIRLLSKRIEKLQSTAVKLIKEDEILQRRYELLLSTYGIGTTSAITLLAELSTLAADMTVRQWVASAGLDPQAYVSGTSVNRRPRISKKGNSRIRKALFLPALTAVRNNKQIKQWYTELVQRDAHRKPIQGIIAVMRKLLHAIYGMFKNDTDFDVNLVFALKYA